MATGVDVPMDEEKSDLISSLGHVEKVEAEAEASDGEFLRETDEELEVETFSAEHDASAGVYAVYLLKHNLNGRTYAGITTDLNRRIKQHNGVTKGGAKYTAAFRGENGGKWEYALCLEGCRVVGP